MRNITNQAIKQTLKVAKRQRPRVSRRLLVQQYGELPRPIGAGRAGLPQRLLGVAGLFSPGLSNYMLFVFFTIWPMRRVFLRPVAPRSGAGHSFHV